MPENRRGDSYTFNSLQEDAIRRAREMQARAHLSPIETSAPEETQASAPPDEDPPGEPLPANEQTHPAKPPPDSPGSPEEPEENLGSGFLDTLLKDNERTLIWVLLLILLEEKADTALIFALMYLAT